MLAEMYASATFLVGYAVESYACFDATTIAVATVDVATTVTAATVVIATATAIVITAANLMPSISCSPY